MPVHEFKVEMTCGGCEKTIRKALSKLGDKVEKVDVNVNEKKVWITSNITTDELLAMLKKTGKTVQYVGLKE